MRNSEPVRDDDRLATVVELHVAAAISWGVPLAAMTDALVVISLHRQGGVTG